MKLFYCDHFVLPLPDGHRFPMRKYSLLRERVIELGIVEPEDLLVPDPVSRADLERAHDPNYVRRVIDGSLSAREIRRIGFPWSPELVERSRRSAGGTLAASRAALADGASVNLAGGTHHAAAASGEGFCVFNDSAIAARAVQAERAADRIAVIDCDVHQGNGTASIFAGDPTVFTFSVHGAKNFPFQKARSDLDVELEDGSTDDQYLEAVERGLAAAVEVGKPDLVIYVSGADPLDGDKFGRLSVSKRGLAARDRMVFETLVGVGIPVAVVMAGGYAPDVQDTVDVHVETVRAAVRGVAATDSFGSRQRVVTG